MNPQTSLLSELLNGSATPTQYAALAVLALAALLGLWWHLDEAKRGARRRSSSPAPRPCGACLRDLPGNYYAALDSTYCLDCEGWFERKRKTARELRRAVRP